MERVPCMCSLVDRNIPLCIPVSAMQLILKRDISNGFGTDKILHELVLL